MSTRPIVEAAIEAIEDNGNNTALEVRDVLTKMLDYTENEDSSPPPSIDVFHFFNNGDPTSNSIAKMFYSFKGIKAGTVNFTFHLELNKDGTFLEPFPVEGELMDTLQSIIHSEMKLSFSVPYFDSERQMISTTEVFLTFNFGDKTIHLDFRNIKVFIVGSTVTTSVHFHLPEFNFG